MSLSCWLLSVALQQTKCSEGKLRGSTLNDKQQGSVCPTLSIGNCQLQCCVAAHSSSSSHPGRKQTNHSSHTAAAAHIINSATQQLTETSATIDGWCEGPTNGDAASAAAVHSFKRSVAINSSSLNDMLRVAAVIQQIMTELSGAELEDNSDHYSKCHN